MKRSKEVERRFDAFRDSLGDALKFKMEAENRKVRELAAELGLSPSALSQIRQGSSGTERNVPNLEKHFRVFDWIGSPIGQYEPDFRPEIVNIGEVWDLIVRLPLAARDRNQMAEVLKVMWHSAVWKKPAERYIA